MNHINWLKPGTISIITGCMFSGKTDELIRRLSVLTLAKKKVLAFKASFDKPYLGQKLKSHNHRVFDALPIKNVQDVITAISDCEKVHGEIDVIAFDEVQFLPIELFPLIEKLAKKNKIIICAGLDKDYYNEFDSLMSRLLVRADDVQKLFAICNVCSDLATHTQRMKDGVPVNCYWPKVFPGGKSFYQARCEKCYVNIKSLPPKNHDVKE